MKYFLAFYGVFLIIGGGLLLLFSKEDLFLELNSLNTTAGDLVFPYITYLGEGYFSILLVLFFLFCRYSLAIISTISFLLTGGVVQLLKHLVFSDVLRPIKHFEGLADVHTVAGVSMHSFFSFPSGHSAGAFSLFFMASLVLLGKWKYLGVILLILAVLTGYSRIYLGQHFPVDVYAGSIIGVGCTWLTYWFISRSKLINKSWADRSLLSSYKKGQKVEV